ncbi:MAG TPA: hypothetical protein VM054_04440 [bacterium]|nr:hypothetical protein [bacterium]
MKPTVVVLLFVALVASFSADFSGKRGYGRFGFRAAYPIALTEPYPQSFENVASPEYSTSVYAAMEGGVGFSDYLELTIGLNFHFATAGASNDLGEELPHYDLTIGEGSVAVGLNGYFIRGNIRPYGHVDLGISFNYTDFDNAPGYTRSLAPAVGVGVGCQFVFGKVFYLEPFVHYRLHASGTYTFNVDEPGFEPVEHDFLATPMVLCTGLGFGFLF